MKQKLQILYLEDNANDAEIVQSTLTAGDIPCNILRVETRTDFVNALAQKEFHLILADYKLPSFDGLSALKIVFEKKPDIPFILVTGAMGEETAIETLKSGATDYILKDKLMRLVPAVKRALKETKETNERKRAEENLRKHQAELETQNEELREMHRIVEESLKKYADLYDFAPVGYFTFDKDGLILEMNLTGADLLGVERDNLIRKPFISFISPEYRETFYSHLQKILVGQTGETCELKLIQKDGTLFDVSVKSMAVKDEKGASLQYRSVISDITDRKKAEGSLQESQSRLKLALSASKIGLWDLNILTNEAYFSPEWKRQIGYEDDEIRNHPEEWERRLHPEDRGKILEILGACIKPPWPVYEVEFRLKHKDGSYRWIYVRGEVFRDRDDKPVRMLGCHIDITERKKMEAEIQKRVEDLQDFYEMAISRELRMKELKEEISELQRKLDKYEKLDD